MIENRTAQILLDRADLWQSCPGSLQNILTRTPAPCFENSNAYAAAGELAALRINSLLEGNLKKYTRAINNLKAAKIRGTATLDKALARFTMDVLGESCREDTMQILADVPIAEMDGQEIKAMADLVLHHADGNLSYFILSLAKEPQRPEDSLRAAIIAQGLLQLYRADRITVYISQPLIRTMSSAAFTLEELSEKATAWEVAVEQLQQNREELHTGEWCKSCPARTYCNLTRKTEG